MEVKAPEAYDKKDKLTIFLAGSIEMGAAEDWQVKVKQAIDAPDRLILNPRRDDWDSSWVQSINNPQFNEQVNWELEALEDADIIIFYFAPDTKSPISLLELGLYVQDQDKWVFVCCPEGFWRKGNIEIVCDRYGRHLWTDLDEMLTKLPGYLEAAEIVL